VAPYKVIGKGAKKSTKGGKIGQMQHPRWVVVTTSGIDDDKDVDGSDEEYVTTTEHDFQRQTR
jgi:hypothetical protein